MGGGQISDDIQKKIDYLTSKVGAPTYSKTPNFKKGRRNRSKGTIPRIGRLLEILKRQKFRRKRRVLEK